MSIRGKLGAVLNRLAPAPDVERPGGEDLGGEPARAVVVSTQGSLSGVERAQWARKLVDLRMTDGREARVECWLNERAHLLLTPGVDVPVRVDANGTLLGLDVVAYEAEARERDPDA